MDNEICFICNKPIKQNKQLVGFIHDRKGKDNTRVHLNCAKLYHEGGYSF